MNKIIIPVVALAMGAALVGSVSSTLAWFQYSNKAQAAFIGTTIYESGNLEIKKSDASWSSRLDSSDVEALMGNPTKEIIPVSPEPIADQTNRAKNDSLKVSDNLPQFYNGLETGVGGVESYGARRALEKNFVQFDLYFRYKKTGQNVSYGEQYLNLVDLTIVDTAGNEPGDTTSTTSLDLFKSVRVHFSSKNGNDDLNALFARDDLNQVAANENNTARKFVNTNTYGQLDLDGDGFNDKAYMYEWEDGANNAVNYGINNSVQTAVNASYGTTDFTIGKLNASENGLKVTVTIWIEGWQPLAYQKQGAVNVLKDNPSPSWDPTVYVNKQFKVGMRFMTSDTLVALPSND